MREKTTILIADDEEVNRILLGKLFENEYDVHMVGDGKEALEYISYNYNSIGVVLLDILMPVIDGFKVLEFLKEKGVLKKIPVILVTGDDDMNVKAKGYDLGAIDIIQKPFNPHIVTRRVKNMIEFYQYKNKLEVLVNEQTKVLKIKNEELMNNNNRILEIMSELVEFRNTESGEHVKRVKAFTRILAEKCAECYPEYGLTTKQVDLIASVSMLHDIGKIVISDTILLKPGRLTDDEYEVMKSHTTKGCEIIHTIAELNEKEYADLSYDICRYHHERYDGGGYPDGLIGDEIPISAQLVSIADVYDALVSERVYKQAYSKEKAFQMIMEGECGAFSEKILHIFEECRNRMEHLSDELN